MTVDPNHVVWGDTAVWVNHIVWGDSLLGIAQRQPRRVGRARRLGRARV